jgi:putative ABC transport system substrate-binding protein
MARARSKLVAEFCMLHGLPAISHFNEFPQAGGLMSYGPDVKDFYLRTAAFVDKVLKGARAGDLPLSITNQFRLVLDSGAARSLGLTLPPALLAAATELIG